MQLKNYNKWNRQNKTQLGKSLDLSDSVVDVLEELLCSLYGMNEEISINEARYRLYTKRRRYRTNLFPLTAGDKISHLLPIKILP